MAIDGAIILFVVAVIAALGLINVLLRKRANPKIVDEVLSLRNGGPINGAFLFECVVKNNGTRPCFVTDVDIKLSSNGRVIKGGRINVSSEEGRDKAKSTNLPVIVSGHEAIPIRVVGKAGFKSGEYPSGGKVVVTVAGRRRPIIKNFGVNNRYLITSHSFK